MDTAKTANRSFRDMILGILVIGVGIPAIDTLFNVAPLALDEWLPEGWGTAAYGALILGLYRWVRDWWKHSGKDKLKGMFDDAMPPLAFATVLIMLASLSACTTMQSEAVAPDGTYYKHSFTQAPFSKSDVADMGNTVQVDADGAWRQTIGSNAKGVDNTPQNEAADGLYSVVGRALTQGLLSFGASSGTYEVSGEVEADEVSGEGLY